MSLTVARCTCTDIDLVDSGVCYPLSAWIANRYGRKTGVYIGYMLIVAGVACSAGPTGAYFVASRAIIGCASCFFSGIVATLITEIAYPTHRSIVTSLYNTGWFVGGTIGAFITFGTRNYQSDWSWRIPTILQLLIPLIALPGFLLAPESPRWMLSVDRTEAAHAMLTKHHDGHNNPELINYELLEISATLQAEKESAQAASYADMFKTKGNRHRFFITVTLALFSQWVGNGVVSYYLPVVLETVNVTSVRDQTLISACMQLWNLFWAVLAATSVDRWGRRVLFLTSASTMLVAYIAVTGLSGSFASTQSAATGLAVIPMLFIFNAGYSLSLYVLADEKMQAGTDWCNRTPLVVSYPCEIWPYRLRSRGVTVMGLTIVVGIVFNIFANPIALEVRLVETSYCHLIGIVSTDEAIGDSMEVLLRLRRCPCGVS